MSEAHVNEALLRLIEDLLADPERLQRVGRLIFRKSEVQDWEPDLGLPEYVAIDAALVLGDLTRVIRGDLPLASDPPPSKKTDLCRDCWDDTPLSELVDGLCSRCRQPPSDFGSSHRPGGRYGLLGPSERDRR